MKEAIAKIFKSPSVNAVNAIKLKRKIYYVYRISYMKKKESFKCSYTMHRNKCMNGGKKIIQILYGENLPIDSILIFAIFIYLLPFHDFYQTDCSNGKMIQAIF